MKDMKNIGFVVLSMLIFSACSSESADKRETLHDEVMAIHDEVMPKMSEVGLLMEEMEACMNVYRTMELDEVSGPKLQAMKEAYGQLNEADNGMFNWMQNYEKPGSEASDEEAIAYLEGQKALISEVAQSINSSIEAGTGLGENCTE
jgi:succinate dehydrogenase flavin-adding protein (antitoxin of CptAB toxin-antitoxin module)